MRKSCVALLALAACHGPPQQLQGAHDYQAVAAIFAAHCGSGTCHTAARLPAGNLDLTPIWYDRVVGVPADEDRARMLVAPGDPGASYLACKLTGDCPFVGTRMPPLGLLADADRQTVLAWIAAGAPGPAAGDAGVADAPGPDVDAALADAAASDGAVSDAPAGADASVGPDAPPPIDAAPPDTTAPTFAGLTSAMSLSPSAVKLTWSAASDDVTPAGAIVYDVYGATAAGGEDFATPSYTTPPGVIAFIATGLVPETRYWFVVRARDAAGNRDDNRTELSALTPAATVSFAADVQPVFMANCTGAVCHTTTYAAEGLDLSSGPVSYAHIVGVPATECPSVFRVAPGDSTTSFVIWKLDGSGPCFGGLPMPLMMPPLPTSTIDKIRIWIDEGALDN